MSVKAKMRCARCGKPFKSSNSKQIYCDACGAKVRQERAAQKAASVPAKAERSVAAPKIVGPGAAMLVPELARTTTPAGPHAATQPDREATPAKPVTDASRTRSTTDSRQNQTQSQPQTRARKPVARPLPLPELTDELRARIEARYLELANPVEFDGIRTQIATELGLPKALIKMAVRDLRARLQLPSWWELQTYRGTDNELGGIRALYVPHLPVPPIGIHRTIAEELHLDPLVVYRAIRRIRAEMRLPRYNPVDAHQSETQGKEPSQQQPVTPHKTEEADAS